MMKLGIRKEGRHLFDVNGVEVKRPVAVNACGRLSRGTLQRIQRSARVEERVFDTMCSLNDLMGCDGKGVCDHLCDPFSIEVRRRFRDLHDRRSPVAAPSPQEAAQELLGDSAFGYATADVPSNTVPFARNKVAWPDRGSIAKDLRCYLPPDLRHLFEWGKGFDLDAVCSGGSGGSVGVDNSAGLHG